jgi:hypothetical protein
MAAARRDYAATLLNDGSVLVSGGGNVQVDGQVRGLTTAELYDPRTGTFAATGSMAAARAGHATTLLADGEILLVGGDDGSTSLASAELYDPRSGTFRGTGSMIATHYAAPAILLHDGRVLITGLSDYSGELPSAELYQP